MSTSSEPSTRLADLRRRFFPRYAALEPEEATTLGIYDHDDALRGMDAASIAERASFFAETAVELDAIAAELDAAPLDALPLDALPLDALPLDALPLDARLDHRALARVCRFEEAAYATRRDETSLEWSLYPYVMIAYQRELGRDARARASEVRRFLADHEANLLASVERGDAPPRTTTVRLIEHELTGAAEALAELDADAARAYVEHIDFLRERVLPRSPSGFVPLGAQTYAWRLRETLGVRGGVDALVERATDELRQTQQRIVALAGALAPSDRSVGDIAAASAFVGELQREHIAAGTDIAQIVQIYRDELARAERFVEEHELFELPRPLALAMQPYPPGMRSRGGGTNWPAPLCDPDGAGQFVINPDPAAHPLAWIPVLAIHEGVPGHYLQSRAFQARFCDDASPVRFIGVADDVAMPRAYFGAMTSIEGFAVHVEALLRERGFHDHGGPTAQRDALFANVAHASRCARVILDAGLHSGELAPDAAAEFMARESGLKAEWARAEIERYQRVPLQAVSYFAGYVQIVELRDKWRAARRAAGESAGDAAFHSWLLDFGPLPPADLAVAI